MRARRRGRPLLFSFAVTCGSLAGALLLGSACDSRPVVPIEDEPDVRADVVPASPEASTAEDAGAADATGDGADVADADADASDAASDAD